MQELGVLEARRQLPQLIQRARGGEQTLITRHGHPVAALVPLNQRVLPLKQALLALEGSGHGCWPRTDAAAHRLAGPPLPPWARLSSLPIGSSLALDASVLIPWLRGDPRPSRTMGSLIEGIALGRWRGVLSMATLATLIGGPLRQGDGVLAARYERVFTDPAGWTLVSLTPGIVIAASRLEHGAGHGPAEALELASAIEGGATAMISLDPLLRAGLPLPC